MTQPNFNFISGYESHDEWYQRLRSAYGGFRLNTGPPDEIVAEGKAIAAHELLAAEKEAADNIERPNETETEYFRRLVKRDATVRTELRAQGMKPPRKETHEEWYERRRQWIKDQPNMSVWDYPAWLNEEGRVVALRENLEDELRDIGEMSPLRKTGEY
jgi:hypothetical protein